MSVQAEVLEKRSVSALREERDDLSKDTIFKVLSNQRRRWIIEYLLTENGLATRAELSEYIAALENNIDRSQLNSSQRKRVYVSLYQTHLPKLEESGVVEYDRDRGSVSTTEKTETLAPYLEQRFDKTEDASPSDQYYLAMSLAGIASFALLQVSESIVTLPWKGVAGTLIAAFLLVSLYRTVDDGFTPGADRFRALSRRLR